MSDDRFDRTNATLTAWEGGDGNDNIDGSPLPDTVLGGDGQDSLNGGAGADTLAGGSGSDVMDGDSGDDRLSGGSGDDSLFGDLGDDTLQGGAGADSLNGGQGDDLYIHGRGDGADRISEASSGSGRDILHLTDGLTAADIRLLGSNGDLFVVLADGTGEVRISEQFDFPDARIETLLFDDGSSLDLTAPMVMDGGDANDFIDSSELGDTLNGGAGSDNLEGNGGDDVLSGDSGDDRLAGDGGNDSLSGGSGEDDLFGGFGNDLLQGGSGDDCLRGGFGDDTYDYARGDGSDIIDERFSDGGGFDVLRLAAGIAVDDVALTSNGADLFIRLRDGSGQVVIQDQLAFAQVQVERLRFADGTEIDLTGAIAQTGLDGDDFLDGNGLAETISGGNGNDNLDGRSGDDVLLGESGDDSLLGGAGADSLSGGDGQDSLDGGDGNDTLDGGAGEDRLRGFDGDDTYLFGPGGFIEIDEISTVGSGFDTIQLADGIGLGDIRIFADTGGDLLISLLDGTGQVRVHEQFEIIRARVELLRLADGTEVDLTGGLALTGDSADDAMAGSDFADTVSGEDGDDFLGGRSGADLVSGGGGEDTLFGDAGADTLDGGTGDDTLNGGLDDDTFIHRRGDGHDRLTDTAGTDTVLFGAGIPASEIVQSRSGDDLFLTLSDGSGSVRIVNHFLTDRNAQVEFARFADGAVLDLVAASTLADLVLTGGDARDNLTGGPGNDSMTGGDDNDRLTGLEGDDVLRGGAGDDTMHGGADDDLYLYEAGDGFDVIDELGGSGRDVLQLGSGIAVSDVRLAASVDDILVVIDGAPGFAFIRIVDHLVRSSSFNFNLDSQVETLRFADGTEVDLTLPLVYRGGDANDGMTANLQDDTLLGFGGNDTLSGQFGADLLEGGAGNDLLQGGADDDVILGGEGADSLFGGEDDDRLTGGAGNDTLRGDAGDDVFVYGLGDGFDTLAEAGSGNGLDVIEFATGIASGDVRLSYSSSSILQLSLRDGSGGITISGQVNGISDFDVELLRFADGTLVDLTGPLLLEGTDGNDRIDSDLPGDTLQGGGGNDNLRGFNGDDVLLGEDGNDVLLGGNDADSLLGGSGSDNLRGDSGDDTLTGGSGDDTLDGGAGDDTYRYARGDGFDLVDESPADGGNDVIELGAGIALADIALSIVTTDELLVRLVDGTGEIRIRDQYGPNADSRIETLRFADGTEIDLTGPLVTQGSDANDLLDGTVLGDTIRGGDGGDDLDGFGGDDLLEGQSGNDALDGDSGDDTLVGGGGNDSLFGSGGADELIGGQGNDSLSGDAGDDTYHYGRGDGFDRINENGSVGSGIDRIVLASGISASDIRFESNGSNLDILLTDGSGGLSIEAHMFAPDARIETLQFADGSVIDLTGPLLLEGGDGSDVVMSGFQGDTVAGGPGADRLDGREGDDTLQGDSGNDTLFGGTADDSLIGGSGNDSLDGDAGNDTLQGGQGSDLLDGEQGDDLYVYARGGGFDTVAETSSVAGGNDALLLTGGIAPGEVRLAQDGTSLSVFLTDGTGAVTLQGQSDAVTRIEQLRFDDGTVIDLTGPLLMQGGAGDDRMTSDGQADTLSGGDGNDTITGDGDGRLFGDAGNDSITTGVGNDLLDGGIGNDTVSGGDGDDTLLGTAGNDSLAGGAGDDTYRFGPGDGNDTINEDRFSQGSGSDVIELEGGLTATDVRLSSPSNGGRDLLVSILSGGGSLAVAGQFADPDNQVELLRFADGSVLDLTGGLVMAGDDGDNGLVGTGFDDTVSGLAGNDTLNGEGGIDLLRGDGGDDRLVGGVGADTLDGGAGDDTLEGGVDGDSYLYARGDGTVRIVEGGGADQIVFGAGITAGEVTAVQSGNSLVLTLTDGSGSLIVENHFLLPVRQVESMLFADGTRIGLVDGIAPVGQVFNGTDAADFTNGSDGDDSMFGGDGADRLIGHAGDDLLDGNAGNDTLQGEEGDDTYVYRPGDGFVTVDENGGGGFDVLSLQGGLLAGDIRLVANSQDLTVVLVDGTGSITLDGHFHRGFGSLFDRSSQVERLQFSDGSELDLSGVRVLQGGSGNDTIGSFILGDTLLGEGGNDFLNGLGGDDVIDGGSGSDDLDGDAGNDSLVGGSGADRLDGGTGADTLVGGADNDTLNGRAGDDVYVYAAGDGDDVIDEGITQSSGLDTLRLGPGIALSDIDLRIASSGNDLLVVMRDGSGQVRILQQFSGAGVSVERLALDDGTLVDLTGPLQTRGDDGNDTLGSSDLGDSLSGAGGNDFLNGFGGDDVLSGDGGDDFLRAGTGGDSLSGGSGDDTLQGDAGDDDLQGGAGDDLLAGGFGDDRFVYARGDGFDVIDESVADNGFDLVDLAPGIARADVRLTVSNNDLFIILTDGSGQIRIDDQFATPTPHIELLRFADGTLIALDGVAGQPGALNSPPQAVDDVAATDEDQPVLVDLLANDLDADGDSLALLSVTDGANGTVSIVGDRISYTPDADFDGSDSFGYTISDGELQDSGTVTVTVLPVNDAPEAIDDVASTDEDTAVTIDVLGNDRDVDNAGGGNAGLSVVSATAASGTVVIGSDGRLTYTPDADFNGSASISYTIADPDGATASADVAVTVLPVNDAPEAVDDAASTDEDTAVTIDVLGNDRDVDNAGGGNAGLSVVSATAASGTVVIGPDGRLTYTPDADFNGSDSISYTIADPDGATANADVAVTVRPVNDAPTAITADNDSVREDAVAGDLVARLLGIDPDGDVLSFTLVDDAGGRFALDGDRLVVAADNLLDHDTAAQHQVQVQGSDPDGLTVLQQLTIDILDVGGGGNGGALDLDGNGDSDALTDGLIALGHAFGAPVQQLTGLAAPGAPGQDAATLAASLAQAEASFLDVDGNGSIDALTDGLMLLGFLLGAPADQVAAFADPDGARSSAQSINDFLEGFDAAA